MLLLELLSRLQNSNKSLLFWNLFTALKFLNKFNIKSSISSLKFFTSFSHRISMTSYLFSLLLTVTTHALHLTSLIKPSSSLIDPSDMLHLIYWNQRPTSLRIPHPNYSSPSQRPLFEHAGLTCYTPLSPSITFSLFHSELKTYLFRKSYPPPQFVSVCHTNLMALDRSPDLFAHRFYVLVLFLSVSVIPMCGRLSWPALVLIDWPTFASFWFYLRLSGS